MASEERGLIFDIVHGSFVDGYGIRTTVFFKGCPLRCTWCCNPEGQSARPEIKLSLSKCTGCGRCVETCPTRAIEEKDDKIALDRGLCDSCGECINVCYEGALDWFGRYYTVEEVYENAMRDADYYRSSGGGVTLGGGEATVQSAFALALMRKLQSDGIHVAIDTCGYTLTKEAFQVLTEADLLLYDIKGLNPERHRRDTGVSNRVIVENLRKLGDMRKPIIIRLPLIPGHTTDEQTLKAEAEFIASIPSVERVDLIPYHNYSTAKYEQLGRVYPLTEPLLSEEEVESIRQLFALRDLPVQVGG
ncbi:MAG: glycyl-radical enzyme activating protein [Armatimonadetes bacterium]|nr:glycyl-radical enzyme activating protein [Armatimonadota bacterium]